MPSVEEIKALGRKLAPDDFRPKWRNMYASLHEVPLSGGKYHAQWEELKTGLDFFTPGFTEGNSKVGEKPEKCDGCGSYHCEGVSDSDEDDECDCHPHS